MKISKANLPEPHKARCETCGVFAKCPRDVIVRGKRLYSRPENPLARRMFGRKKPIEVTT
jgi:hypothetical protein